MKQTFKEYHKYTDREFKHLWENCVFVFDTNTLLNMYRYSRDTVKQYLDILSNLKTSKQLWIPYQVGFEFYENRLNVINEYEKSYDEILSILEKAKHDIETKYKNHPFLDLGDQMTSGLSGIESKIKKTQAKHPKWLEKDDVLDSLNDLFHGNVGESYCKERISEIIKIGKERYENNIPPGFKDNKKPENKKYGDLIIWFQILDKAKECKKPIIFISGDVKEDWWLEIGGKRLMPLPQLKKEMLDIANVDFHIYTADMFLEYARTDSKQVNDKTIDEVRKIRELEEFRIMTKRRMNTLKYKDGLMLNDDSLLILLEKYVDKYIIMFGDNKELRNIIRNIDINRREGLNILLIKMIKVKENLADGAYDKDLIIKMYMIIKRSIYNLECIINESDSDVSVKSILIVKYLNDLKFMYEELCKYV